MEFRIMKNTSDGLFKVQVRRWFVWHNLIAESDRPWLASSMNFTETGTLFRTYAEAYDKGCDFVDPSRHNVPEWIRVGPD